jgi:hypothetical protein
MISLKVVETSESFRKKVINAICQELVFKILKITPKVKESISRGIKPILEKSNGYSLLTENEKIKAETGLPYGREKEYLDKIFSKIIENITVEPTIPHPVGNQINGGFNIGIMFADFSDIKALDVAVIKSKNGPNMWLYWLLEQGGQLAVENYEVVYEAGTGRSKLAHMEKIENGFSVTGGWSVDKDIRGTISDNWLTRAFIDSKNEVELLILHSVKSEIEKVL